MLKSDQPSHPSTSAQPFAISQPRVWLVYTVAALLTLGTLYDIATGYEHWPFSPYPLYHKAQLSHTAVQALLYGVRAFEGAEEVPLFEDKYIQPFDRVRLAVALDRLTRRPDDGRALRDALSDCLTRYESLRAAERHHGPPLVGIRLYRVEWSLEPSAGNLNHPDTRTLLAEVLNPTGGR